MLGYSQPRSSQVPRRRRHRFADTHILRHIFKHRQRQLMSEVQWSESRNPLQRNGFHNQPQLTTTE